MNLPLKICEGGKVTSVEDVLSGPFKYQLINKMKHEKFENRSLYTRKQSGLDE